MNRNDFLNGLALIFGASGTAGGARPPTKNIAGLVVPDSTLAREATAIATASLPPEIYNHSLRTYLFAELLANAQHIDHDVEAVYVAAILHDTGLSDAHMSERNRFEVDGALVARRLLSSHTITGERAELVWDAITLHDSSLARWKQAEVRLVSQGVNADFGAGLDTLERSDVIAILKAAPRTNFVPVFLDHVAAVAKKKPFATGNCFVTDVAYRMVPGFHLENFVDAVKDDPFASYLSIR